MNRFHPFGKSALHFVPCLLALATTSLQAATLIWDSNSGETGAQDGGGNWTVGGATFWNGSSNVVTSDDITTDKAQFGNSATLASPATVHVSTQSINGLIFNTTTTNGYTLTASSAGQVLTIGTGGIVMNSGAQDSTVGSANLGITLGAAQNWTNNSTTKLLTIGGAVDNGGFLLTAGNGNTTISGAISGLGGLTKNGTGTLKLTSTSNNYSGTTTITAGILDVGDMANLSSNSYLSIGAAQLQGYGTFSRTNSTSVSGSNWKPTATTSGFSAKGGKLIVNTSITRVSTLTSNVPLNSAESDSELQWSGGINLGNGPMTLNVIEGFDANSFVTVSGKITAGTSLAKRGKGLLVLTNTTNDFTSQFTIGAGTVVAGGNAPASGTGVFGAAANTVRVGGGTTLTPSASDAPTLLVDGGYTVTNNILVGGVSNTLAYNATIGGRNTGGTSTYESSITLDTTATNYTFTMQAATGGTTEFKTGTWTTNDKAITVGSSGNTGIVKLSNTLDTTGAVNVNFGTLLVNGQLNGGGSDLTVASGATLGGSGSIAKATVIHGHLAPGHGIGTLTINGNLTLSAMAGGSGKLDYELGPTAASDKIVCGGTLDIGAGLLGLNDFNFTDLGELENGTYKLIETSSTITGSLDAGNTNGTFGSATLLLRKSIDGTDLELAVSGLGGQTAFEAWATGNEPFDGDANGDGVEDGLAFLLGAATPGTDATGLLPEVSENGGNLILEFDCLATANRGASVLNLQYDGDLAAPWTTASVPGAVGNTTVGNVSFVATSNGSLIHIVATINDATEAAGGRLFGRLQGIK